MADVFISYAREDRQWVEQLANRLQSAGFSVWWDWDLLVGKRYRETIDAELQACRAAVVVWSQYSIRSDFVRDEAEEAQQRNVLLPVLKEAVRPPAGFRQIQSADLSTWVGDETHGEFRRVMKGVAHMVGRPEAATAPIVEHPRTTDAAPVTAQPEPFRAVPVKPVPTPAAISPSLPVHIKLPASPFKNLPPISHPVWRYAAIGAIAVAASVYLIIQFTRPSPQPPIKPKSDETITRNDADQSGGTQASQTASATGAPATGTPTDTSGLNSAVAIVIQKAEASDKNARARALLAREQLKSADAASARARQGESSSVGLLNGRDAAGNSFAFAGEIADGTEQGAGAAAISNGNHYSGQWFGGSAQGLGVFTYSNGDQYSGEFNENLESGVGAVTFTDKSKGLGYSGQWAANAYNGYGVYYFQNGTRLEGLWHAGQVNGLGARFDSGGKLLEQGTYLNSVLKR